MIINATFSLQVMRAGEEREREKLEIQSYTFLRFNNHHHDNHYHDSAVLTYPTFKGVFCTVSGRPSAQEGVTEGEGAGGVEERGMGGRGTTG